MTSPPAPPAVLEKSFADVSLLAGLLIDKIQYHIPLYRQHQRLQDSGINLSRATLINYFNLTAELLSPIYNAQLESILKSLVISMDETPTKVSKTQSGGKGMKTSYYWPIYGDKDEICFEWRPSREYRHVAEILKEYRGILLTDGFPAYQKYADANEGTTRGLLPNRPGRPDGVHIFGTSIRKCHVFLGPRMALETPDTRSTTKKVQLRPISLTWATRFFKSPLGNTPTRAQCWSHARRKFVDALKYDPELANKALDYISILYENGRYIKDNQPNEKEKMLYRLEHSKATVEEFFYWLEILSAKWHFYLLDLLS